MASNITLYIAEHNKTGLKYFGMTRKYFTEIELQENYHGSGVEWKKHLKKHGDDVTMKIYGIFNENDVKEIALSFSEKNNIAKSKKWANRKYEDGINGWNNKGYIPTNETKKKWLNSMLKVDNEGKNGFDRMKINFMKNVDEHVYKANKTKENNIVDGLNINQRTGVKHSILMKQKYANGEINSFGSKNSNAKKINIFNEKNELMFECYGTFKQICNENDLPFNALKKSYQENGKKIYKKTFNGNTPKKFYKFKNWYAKEVL